MKSSFDAFFILKMKRFDYFDKYLDVITLKIEIIFMFFC